MSFKENLKSELQFQDIQLKELAEKTGISKYTLGNYLTGHNSIPTADSAVKIAQVLGVSVEYLVTGKSNEMKNTGLSAKTKALINDFETLDSNDQNAVQALIAVMKQRYMSVAPK